MRILAIVATYYPDMEMLQRSVCSYCSMVDKLIVWENTPESEALSYRLPESFSAEYLSDGENSLATAYNYAFRYALENGFDCILTMDQDSVFTDFAVYRRRAEKLLQNQIAVITPDLSGGLASERFSPVGLMLNSGAIVPTGILKRTGGWCEDYPIDNLDIDFSLNVAENGFTVLRCDGSYMEHHQGNVNRIRCFGRDFVCFNYSPLRLYHIFRDVIIIYRKHGKPDLLRKVIRGYIFRTYFFRVLLLEKDKAVKCRAMLCGIWHGIKAEVVR